MAETTERIAMQQRHEVVLEQDGIAITATTPENLRSVLLDDGWHDVQKAKLIQFALAPGGSLPKPNKFYSAVSVFDKTNERYIVIPLSKILAFEGVEEVVQD